MCLEKKKMMGKVLTIGLVLVANEIAAFQAPAIFSMNLPLSFARSNFVGQRVSTSNKLPTLRMSTSNPKSATSDSPKFALLFDCDGVIVLTEELHRLAYNGAFSDFELKVGSEPVNWSVEHYDILQNTVGGGKPKMKWHFARSGWPTGRHGAVPTTKEEQDKLVDELQDRKTEIYRRIVAEGAEARPGVLRLMDEALAREDIAVGICSAGTRAGFEQVVDSIVGKQRLERLDVIMAGDDVPRKKPDPLIYVMAQEKLGLQADRCVVIEDSLVGLRAAKGAGSKCVITYTASTSKEDFYGEGADAVLPNLSKVSLRDIFAPLERGESELLAGLRDPHRAVADAAK